MEITKEIPNLIPADLVSLPPEVFYRHIFSKLEYSELVRLRRVCETTKEYADDFIRNNFKDQVREINETSFTLEHFLHVNLPTSSIFINNSSPAIFEDPLIPEFLRLYGNGITHVRIHHFGAFMSKPELHFFANLPNLQHLDLDYMDCMTILRNVSGIEARSEESPFPENFKNLKTLKLNEVQVSNNDGFFDAWDLLRYCEKLEYLKHPLLKHNDGFQPPRHLLHHLGCVAEYIKKRDYNNPDQPNLQFYDLEHFYYGNYELVPLCAFLKVKLLNANSKLIGPGSMVDWPNSPLVSLRNVQVQAFMEELPNLEKLVVESTERSSFAESWSWPREAGDDEEDGEELVQIPQWPKLKTLDLKIDSTQMLGDEDYPDTDVENFLHFLFATGPGRVRENVTELAIRYPADRMFTHVPIPRARNVIASCPFVTKLILQGWMGLNKHVIRFWEGLPLLEEVVLEECAKLGNVAFVGTEQEDPVFLKLKNLKKLSLKRMDLMPKITDLAFDLVFRHLTVKEFCLTSDKPIQSVTAAGIGSLLTGNFNKSVEKFRLMAGPWMEFPRKRF